jgi:sec-independent protein translocase protein TatA
MPNLKGWEWLIIVALVLLLFGAKRLPDAARGLGRSLRIFKAETKGLADKDGPDAGAAGAAATSAVPASDTPSLPPAQDAPATDSVPTERREG